MRRRRGQRVDTSQNPQIIAARRPELQPGRKCEMTFFRGKHEGDGVGCKSGA